MPRLLRHWILHVAPGLRVRVYAAQRERWHAAAAPSPQGAHRLCDHHRGPLRVLHQEQPPAEPVHHVPRARVGHRRRLWLPREQRRQPAHDVAACPHDAAGGGCHQRASVHDVRAAEGRVRDWRHGWSCVAVQGLSEQRLRCQARLWVNRLWRLRWRRLPHLGHCGHRHRRAAGAGAGHWHVRAQQVWLVQVGAGLQRVCSKRHWCHGRGCSPSARWARWAWQGPRWSWQGPRWRPWGPRWAPRPH
mmetsp:Transcript_24200/g.77693  ORF Transcript_24200/g.77693 Transcript_24200/m.77693 type:complete len:246 (-) Transcript_24200:55-792(-)